MQDLKELRGETGAGLTDVKKALKGAGGGREEALQIIRIEGLRSLSKREGRSTGIGLIAAKITNITAGWRGTLVEVNAETGFVVKTEKFIDIAEVVLQVAAESSTSTAEELVKAKTADGTVEDTIDVVVAIIDEKPDVTNVRQVEGEAVDVYLHRSPQDLPPTIGVLATTDKVGTGVAHDVAVHIAAYSPEYLNRDEVPAETVEREREALIEATIAEGRPEAAVAKIAEGKISGFFKENMLLDRPYAKDPKTTVDKVMEALKGKVTGFTHLQADE